MTTLALVALSVACLVFVVLWRRAAADVATCESLYGKILNSVLGEASRKRKQRWQLMEQLRDAQTYGDNLAAMLATAKARTEKIRYEWLMDAIRDAGEIEDLEERIAELEVQLALLKECAA